MHQRRVLTVSGFVVLLLAIVVSARPQQSPASLSVSNVRCAGPLIRMSLANTGSQRLGAWVLRVEALSASQTVRTLEVGEDNYLALARQKAGEDSSEGSIPTGASREATYGFTAPSGTTTCSATTLAVILEDGTVQGNDLAAASFLRERDKDAASIDLVLPKLQAALAKSSKDQRDESLRTILQALNESANRSLITSELTQKTERAVTSDPSEGRGVLERLVRQLTLARAAAAAHHGQPQK